METAEVYNRLTEKFPFLSYGKYLDNEFVGIIQNADNQLVSIYVLNKIHDEKLKKDFLEYGYEWWTESNRMIPINVFLKDKFRPFREILCTFAAKDFEHICGPVVSLDNHMTKRIKRRQIQLVRRCD